MTPVAQLHVELIYSSCLGTFCSLNHEMSHKFLLKILISIQFLKNKEILIIKTQTDKEDYSLILYIV